MILPRHYHDNNGTVLLWLVAADSLKEMLAWFSKMPLELALVRRISQDRKAAYQGKDWSEFKATEPQGFSKRVSAPINKH